MASSLSFTPGFTHTYYDTGKTLKVVIDYSGFPDYDDFSAMTLQITGENTSTGVTLDIYDTVVSAMTGTITASSGDSTLTGTGTLFTTEISAGDYITFGDDTDKIYLVASITNNTTLVLDSGLAAGLIASTIKKYVGSIYLDAEDFGQTSGGTISDDIYEFIYVLTFTGSTGETGSYKMKQSLTCNIYCYVQSRIADIPENYNCDGCDNDYLIDTAKIFFYYKALEAASYNGSTTHYNTLLSALCDIKDLTTSNCGCS